MLGLLGGVGLTTTNGIATKTVAHNLNYRDLFFRPLPDAVFSTRESRALDSVRSVTTTLGGWSGDDTLALRRAEVRASLARLYGDPAADLWDDLQAQHGRRSARQGRLPPRARPRRRTHRSRSSSSRTATRTAATCSRCKVRRGRRRPASRSTPSRSGRPATRRCADARPTEDSSSAAVAGPPASGTASRPTRRRCARSRSRRAAGSSGRRRQETCKPRTRSWVRASAGRTCRWRSRRTSSRGPWFSCC
jgi:hypothetical protein